MIFLPENNISEDEQYCPSCGEIIKREAVICPECGVRVEEIPTVEERVRDTSEYEPKNGNGGSIGAGIGWMIVLSIFLFWRDFLIFSGCRILSELIDLQETKSVKTSKEKSNIDI